LDFLVICCFVKQTGEPYGYQGTYRVGGHVNTDNNEYIEKTTIMTQDDKL